MISDDERTPFMPSNMTASVSDEHILQTLLTWLNMPNDREERRFLEVHSELLTSESLHILNGLLKESPHGKERVIRDHLKLLRDALDRGGSVMAIREAYVNTHGGWNLDLPPWLEEVKRQYDHLLALGPSKSTAAAAVGVLQEARR